MYTTINHEIRKKFDLSLNEYAICDSVYHLSRDRPCNMSKENLGNFIGISKQAVHTILNKLENKNLISRPHRQHVRTTEIWNNEIINQYRDSKESLPDSKDFLPQTVKKVDSGSKESLLNINNNNIDKNIDKKGEIPCFNPQKKPPTFEEWKTYIVKMKYTCDPEMTFAHYVQNGWRQSNKNLIIDWRAAATTCNGFQKKRSAEPPKDTRPFNQRNAYLDGLPPEVLESKKQESEKELQELLKRDAERFEKQFIEDKTHE